MEECRSTVLTNIDFMMKISVKFKRSWENSGINIRLTFIKSMHYVVYNYIRIK